MKLSWSKIAIGAVLLALVAAFLMAADGRVLSRRVGVTVYNDGQVMVQVPYRGDGPRGLVTVSIDGQVVVHAMPGTPRRYWNNNYYTTLPDLSPRERLLVRVDYDGPERSESVLVRVRPSQASAPSMADDDTAGPIAVARAMYMLAKAHWHDDKLPANPLTAAAELEDDMRSGLVAGANLWAAKKGLPIRTTSVSSFTVFAPGDVAQVRVHDRMATLTGVVRMGADTFIEVEYPHGPTGTTVYPVVPDMLRWGIIHTWQ